jgi:hypothetical protein
LFESSKLIWCILKFLTNALSFHHFAPPKVTLESKRLESSYPKVFRLLQKANQLVVLCLVDGVFYCPFLFW